jgi:beta-lactamase class A
MSNTMSRILNMLPVSPTPSGITAHSIGARPPDLDAHSPTVVWQAVEVSVELAAIFEAAGCDGSVCAQLGDGDREVALAADQPVVAASVIKVLIAVETERGIANGSLDPRQRVRLASVGRTPGPVGFSLYGHEVEVALGDLLVPMLTISDNEATDALIGIVGLSAINQTAIELGLSNTVIVSDYGATIGGIAQAAGFSDWDTMIAWSSSGSPSERERQAVEDKLRAAPQLQPGTATRTTPRDMCQLLREIWADRAAPPESCRRIRRLMSQQLTRNRLAAGFSPPVTVAAKSGGLLGIFRHEVGVIQLPDAWCPIAIFTTARPTGTSTATATNAAIAKAAALAVSSLRAR